MPPAITGLGGILIAGVTILGGRLVTRPDRIEAASTAFRQDLMKELAEAKAEREACRDRQDELTTQLGEIQQQVWSLQRDLSDRDELKRQLAAALAERDALQRLMDRRGGRGTNEPFPPP